MEQSATSIIMIMLVVFVFMPALFMGMLHANRQKINEAMYLSTKCLQDGVENSDYALEEIAQGYAYSDDPIMRVRLDEAKVFTEFDDLLFQNINNVEQFARIRNNIVCEMIIYPDRYVVWNKPYSETGITLDTDDANTKKLKSEYYFSTSQAYDDYFSGQREQYVSVPKYFTFRDVHKSEDENGVITYGKDENLILTLGEGTTAQRGYYYINTLNDKIRRVGDTSSWRNITQLITDPNLHSPKKYDKATDTLVTNVETNFINPADRVLTTYDKNQCIIDTLNKEISYYTGGVMMDFINPQSARQKEMKNVKQDFNFFTGITFLVIYREDSVLNVKGNFFNFNQYTAAGFTLEN